MDKSLSPMLKELRLPAFNDYHSALEAQATKGAWSYSTYLGKLCEQELARRYQSRIAKWTHEARLPQSKTFDTFQFEELEPTVQKQIIALRDNTQWALEANNVLLIGPSGVGKSHIAAALTRQLIEQGIRAKWMSATGLVQHLQHAKQELELMSAMTRFDKYRAVVIDDIGYVKKSDAETQVLFEFIAHRYESGSLIVTSNQPFSQWDQIFPDSLMTVAAIDRIIHHATIIEIDKDSFRQTHRKKQQQRTVSA